MLASLVATHPTRTLLPASFALSFLSLSLTPSFISLIFLLTSLLLYTRESVLDRYSVLKVVSLWVALTASISISHLQPSLQALSTPSMSIVSLILLSGMSSLVALVPIITRNFIKLPGSRMQALVFPTMWAAVWLVISRLSPLGRLVTWTPLSGVDSYEWIRVVLGFAGIDWIVAAWACIATTFIENTLSKHEKEVNLLHDVDERTPQSTRKRPDILMSLTGFLLVLTVPSFFVDHLPLPVISPSTTPLGVACVLPQRSDGPQLDRFITETRKYASQAKILLWPEGAVAFETEVAKVDAFEAVRALASKHNVWIGVSFEERVSGEGSMRDGLRHNGLALIGGEGVEMTYYKRKLVPIAESFSQISSGEDPFVHTIDLPRPKDMPKEDWGSSLTREIPISASICLDFSAPLTALSSRPALVLAPAKTWHIGVGRAMYELARARGKEIGADVLWCDGGAGGLSGVSGDVQVGMKSWVKIIGVPYPAKERRTLYGICGDWLVLGVFLGIPGLAWVIGRNNGRADFNIGPAITSAKRHGQGLIARIRGTRQLETNATPRDERLIDDS